MESFKTYYFLSIFLLVSSISLGQIEKTNLTQDKETYDFLVPSLDIIYQNHPNIDSLGIEFIEDEPSYLQLFFNDTINNKTTKKVTVINYDLNFLGDQYLLKQQYEDILSFIQKINPDKFQKGTRTSSDHRLFLMFDRTKVRHGYVFARVNYAFHDDIRQLKNMLQNSYKKEYFVPKGDSVLIIQAIVNRDRTLGDIAMIVGQYSSFYDFILRELRKTGNSWNPMLNNGTPLRSLVDIFVKLDTTNCIQISITGRGRRLQLKDNDKSTPIFY